MYGDRSLYGVSIHYVFLSVPEAIISMKFIHDKGPIPQFLLGLLGAIAIAVLAVLVLASPTGARTADVGAAPFATSTSTGTPTSIPSDCTTSVNYYVVPSGSATVVPGTVDIGNHCNDCTTAITMPFPVQLYDRYFTTANVSSNGNLQFLSNDPSGSNHCLPQSSFNYAIFALWDNLDTSAPGNGVFTVVTGTAPNRVFSVEWRAFSSSGNGSVNPEIQLYENPILQQFDIVYGLFGSPNNSSTVGVQQDTGSQYTVWVCNGGSNQLSTGLRLSMQYVCGTPTPTSTTTRTPTVTPTSTITPTFTRTATITQTQVPSNTPTVTQTFTPVPTFTNTRTSTSTPSFTSTNTATNTPTNTATYTYTVTPTNTATSTATHTSTRTSTPSSTSTSTSTPTDTYTPTDT